MSGPRLVTPAIDAWRRRGGAQRDALWAAACWQMSALEVVRERPACLTAVHVPAPWELRERPVTAYTLDVPNPDDWQDPEYCLGRRVVRPWPSASAEQALDLQARYRVDSCLGEANAVLETDSHAGLLVTAEEGRGQGAPAAHRPTDARNEWSRARRGAWT